MKKLETKNYIMELVVEDIVVIKSKNGKCKGGILLLSNIDRIIQLGQIANGKELDLVIQTGFDV